MRVLLTGPAPLGGSSFQTLLQEIDSETLILPDPFSPVLLDRIGQGSFDGVICSADGSLALDMVSRIHFRNPQVPIVVLSSHSDPGFESRAGTSGASIILAKDAVLEVVTECIHRFMLLTASCKQLGETMDTNARLRRELAALILDIKPAALSAQAAGRPLPKRKLLPLLVENQPDEAFQMIKAFEEAQVYAPIPPARSPEDAIAYLQGDSPYCDRDIHPLPNCILLDLSPMTLNIKFLQWLRLQSPLLPGIPVIVLSTSGEPQEVEEAYGHSANSFMVKPRAFEDLVNMVRGIDLYWTRINIQSPR